MSSILLFHHPDKFHFILIDSFYSFQIFDRGRNETDGINDYSISISKFFFFFNLLRKLREREESIPRTKGIQVGEKIVDIARVDIAGGSKKGSVNARDTRRVRMEVT